jgi:hypothetical protein
MANPVILISGKKYMWDGVDYPNKDKASEAIKTYQGDGFEVEPCEEDGKTLLYSRRVVNKTVIAGT